LDKLKLHELAIGSDSRNRCLLSAFSSKTGRNQPSNTRFVFGPSKWIRGLIRPPEGYGLAYIDFSSQEIAIAAALSGDERMMEGYETGDPYLAFAKAAGLAPPDATKTSHKAERDRCKAVVLGVNYGMGADALAACLGIPPVEARELIRLHREAYRRFWSWSNEVVNAAMITGEVLSVFGWRLRVAGCANPRALMNFPMQANGAEMMRIAAIAGTEAAIEICAPIHDAFLIQAPLRRLDETVEHMRVLMTDSGRVITSGFPVRTDATITRFPDRYMDEGGQAMWERVMGLLPAQQGAAA
jgi:DNA polymerase I-like protein with 3'-5' exonuclease and polymerase domains